MSVLFDLRKMGLNSMEFHLSDQDPVLTLKFPLKNDILTHGREHFDAGRYLFFLGSLACFFCFKGLRALHDISWTLNPGPEMVIYRS